MTSEQKAWYEYGIEKGTCNLLKKCNSPLYRLMLKSVWGKRKAAHDYLKHRKEQQ